MKRLPLMALILAISAACTEFARHTNQEEGEITVSAAEATVKGREIASEGTEYEAIRVLEVVGNLKHPWSVAFLPEGEMLITERLGRLNLLADGELTEISNLPNISRQGQGGLLDVSVHPDYKENGWIYWTYSQPNNQGETATALARGRIEKSTLVDVEELFVQNRYSQPGRHYGSRLAWTNEGKLLMSIGDRGSNPPRAQDNSDHAGTLIRLNDDGSVPKDNPFVEDEEVLDEIFDLSREDVTS